MRDNVANRELFSAHTDAYMQKMHVRYAYLIQFGNIMPIERINDYREDMKLSGLAGRVNCHYSLFPNGGKREREKTPAAF